MVILTDRWSTLLSGNLIRRALPPPQGGGSLSFKKNSSLVFKMFSLFLRGGHFHLASSSEKFMPPPDQESPVTEMLNHSVWDFVV